MQETIATTERERTTLGLTDREKEVLGLMACGWDNSAIAEKLDIAQRTAAQHLSIIYEKLSADYDCTGRNKRTYCAILYLSGIITEGVNKDYGET